jgi:hypothetical protein
MRAAASALRAIGITPGRPIEGTHYFSFTLRAVFADSIMNENFCLRQGGNDAM